MQMRMGVEASFVAFSNSGLAYHGGGPATLFANRQPLPGAVQPEVQRKQETRASPCRHSSSAGSVRLPSGRDASAPAIVKHGSNCFLPQTSFQCRHHTLSHGAAAADVDVTHGMQ